MLQERTIADKMDRQLTHRGAARSVTALAAMLAHEIKNPLSGIRGAAQLLETSASDDDRTLTRLICDEADRIVKLVDRMEVFTDERPIEREPVNIHVVLDHVKRLAHSGFARHIKFVEEYDPSLPPVLANRDQLIQLFLNLVKNAAEAIGEGATDGEIQLTTAFRPGVRLARPGSKTRVSLPLEFCVKDNGPGVPDDLLPHLFDPFVTTKPTGSGLGLALVVQDRRRSRRHHRMRVATATDRSFAYSCPCIWATSPSRAALPRGDADACRKYSGGRRRCGDPHRAQPGAVARRLRGALDQQCRDAVALGQPGRRRSRHHRRGDAGRERLRPAAAHQEAAARTCRC